MVNSPKFTFNIVLKIANYFLNTEKLKSPVNIPKEKKKYSLNSVEQNIPTMQLQMCSFPSYRDLCVDLFYDPRREARTSQMHSSRDSI